MPDLTPDQIDERADILWSVDEQACQGCGRSALDCHAASDPRWLIDSELTPNASVPEEPIRLAIIRCPECA